MTSSSDAKAASPAAASAPPAGGSAYARFIPREELKSFAAWTPGSFGEGGNGSAARSGQDDAGAVAEAPPLDAATQLQQARQAGYQDGYRDGLVALDAFKQSYAQQLTAQVTLLTQSYQERLAALEQGVATQVAEVALALARQVVRSELQVQPELVAAVAHEALAAVLPAAQCVVLHLHPQDHALVQAHAGEALAARGARLVADAALARGGCVVESEIGVIDASIEARWRQASAAMGRPGEWNSSPLPLAGEGEGEGQPQPSPQPSPASGRGGKA